MVKKCLFVTSLTLIFLLGWQIGDIPTNRLFIPHYTSKGGVKFVQSK